MPGKFIKEISDEDYRKFFQSDILVKDNAEITFEAFKLAFEKKVIDSKEETAGKIVEIVMRKMPFLEKLTDCEVDQMIATLKTPQGYAIREMITFLLENIGDIIDDRAEEIGLSCFDLVIEIVDLNKRICDPKTDKIKMN